MDGAGVATLSSTASRVVLMKRAGSAKRVRWTATNTDTAILITISFGDVRAVAGQGIVLQPGATIGDSNSGNYRVSQENMNAIAASGTPALSWTEGLE